MKNLNDYVIFVETVTDTPSKDLTEFMNRLDMLDGNYLGYGKHGPDINVPLVITSAMGLSAKSGEFMEIIRKNLLQENNINDEEFSFLKNKIGDLIFYWANACSALGLSPEEVIEENVRKLAARYPNGFEISKSENRREGDV